MERIVGESSDLLLARVNRELERISREQHRLARTKAMLQEQATRLRLRAAPETVRSVLEALLTPSDDDPTGWTDTWPPATAVAASSIRGRRHVMDALSTE